MTLTATTAWRDAMDGAREDLRTLVTIYDGTTTWKTVSGSMHPSSDLVNVDVGIRKVATAGIDINPLTREVESGQLFVDFDDAWLRPIMTANRLKGQKISCFIGSKWLDEADFLPAFAGSIERFGLGNGIVTAKVSDPYVNLKAKVSGAWVRKHPLEMLYFGDGTGVLERAGFVSFDTASFDPSAAAYSSFGHVVVSHGGAVGTEAATNTAEPKEAGEIASNAAALIGGGLVVTEAGAVKFLRTDPAAAASDSWSEADVLPGSFEQETGDDLVVNQCVFTHNFKGYTWVINDADSQAAYAYPGAATRVYPHSFTEFVLHAKASLYSGGDIAAATVNPTVDLNPANPEGFAGNRSEAWAQVSASRPAYLWLDSTYSSGGLEVIKAETLTKAGTRNIAYNEPTTGAQTIIVDVPRRLTYTTTTRAQFSSAAINHYAYASGSTTMMSVVVDVTALALLSEYLFLRFKYGCPVVRFKTSLSKSRFQPGDLINFTYSRFVDYGKDGLAAEKMEIVGKEMDLGGSEPGVTWTLAGVGQTATNKNGAAWMGQFGDNGKGSSPSNLQNALENFSEQPYVKSGLVISATAGLGISISAGSAVLRDFITRRLVAETHTCTASKDTYIAIDCASGGIAYDPVNNGATQPAKGQTEAWLGKVITNGVAVTSVDLTLKEDSPYLGDQIKDLTITEAQLGPLSVTTPKIGNLAVETAKIANLAVEEGKIGSLAVTEGKVGALAITEGKIGALAVTEGKVGALAITSGKLGANSVIAGKLADGSVDTAARLATGVVTAPKVADQVIDDQHVYQKRRVVLNANPNLLRYR